MTLQEIAANIEAQHDVSYHDEGCNCFERLLAAVRGEQDPDGEGYRWPIYTYTVAEPPQFGPETPLDYTMRQMRQSIAESVYANYETLASKNIQGLSSVLDNSITFIGWKGESDA